jgi:hypothetical protein
MCDSKETSSAEWTSSNPFLFYFGSSASSSALRFSSLRPSGAITNALTMKCGARRSTIFSAACAARYRFRPASQNDRRIATEMPTGAHSPRVTQTQLCITNWRTPRSPRANPVLLSARRFVSPVKIVDVSSPKQRSTKRARRPDRKQHWDSSGMVPHHVAARGVLDHEVIAWV